MTNFARAIAPPRAPGVVPVICAILALIVVLAARIAGPSDLWDQTQPKTIAYTTDIIVNGRWILPVERGEKPATKPPLYNWLAAPAVAVFGFGCETAHKLPSYIAFIALWGLTCWLGRRILHNEQGWWCGVILCAAYPLFKLAGLARPDMLLTLWLVLGWAACTALLIRGRDCARNSGALMVLFWLCIALGGLTKGPPVIALLLFALIAGKAITGSWSSGGVLRWRWGLPIALAVIAGWVAAVWVVNPEHLYQELWYDEIFGRVTGVGEEGSRTGPMSLVTRILHIPTYYLLRFAPWSFISLLSLLFLLQRSGPGRERFWRGFDPAGRWLMASGILLIIVIALYSLSAGKRADYIAAATRPARCSRAGFALFRLRGRGWIAIPATAAVNSRAGHRERSAAAPRA
jgi:4-amino-4-deoxy-L-arabinose transferase-like glycosyltransferase